jgi:acetyl-CoA carboxylase biotin carboxyl carrier protein
VDLTSDDVQDILNLLDGLPFGEMHLRTARFSLSLRRTPDGEWTQEMQIRPEPTMTPAAVAAGAGGAAGASGAAGAGGASGAPAGAGGAAGAPARSGGSVSRQGAAPGQGAAPDGLRAVRAPLPGTFYRAPMPGAPPFVETGSHVEPDTVVGIIETMKLMNSVCAGVRGTVGEILLADAQPAEQDTVLLWIREG